MAERCVNALKQWTGKARATIVYDSTVDEFTDDGLFNKAKGKRNIAIVGFTTDGDVFGGFYSVAGTGQDKFFHDPNMVIFSFESHGRCMTPQRFVVKDEWKKSAHVRFYKNNSYGWFVKFDGGLGWFYLGNEMSRTLCVSLSHAFEDIEDTTLTGKRDYEKFTCCQLVAVQLS